MTAMLHCLVGDIADEIRVQPAERLRRPRTTRAISRSSRRCSRPVCSIGRRWWRLLLRRADEERIATGAKARSGRREARVLQGLVSHDDGAVAAAAMALILARGRRRDRFGQCLLHFDDLPRDEARMRLSMLVAAAIAP